MGKIEIKGTEQEEPVYVKLVGDSSVGKTAMILAYKEKQFPTDHLPRYAEADVVIDVNDTKVYTILTEFHVQRDSSCYRRLRYHDMPTDCFVFCFSLNDLSTYENLANRWYPEVKLRFSNTPIVLVGTKGDLECQDDTGRISLELCEELRDKIGASRYIECSAKKLQSLDEAFVEAVQAAIFYKTHARKCCIL